MPRWSVRAGLAAAGAGLGMSLPPHAGQASLDGFAITWAWHWLQRLDGLIAPSGIG